MPDKKIHLLITSERGVGRNFVIKKSTLRKCAVCSGFILLFLVTSSFLGLQRHLRTKELHGELDNLYNELGQLRNTRQTMATALEQRLQSLQQELEQERNRKVQIEGHYEEQVAQITEEKEAVIEQLKKERNNLLNESISELEERTKKLKAVLDHVGVKVKVKEDPGHSGGPYMERPEDYSNRLLNRTDKYLQVFDQLPLGRPAGKEISSVFGYRTDPVNRKKAFHSGLDFPGKHGDPVKATAKGKVKSVTRDAGYGLHVVIEHGNGYATLFAHLQQAQVKAGDIVTRGEVIGAVGSSGRTTCPHLHYEILQKGKPINPMKFVQISSQVLQLSANN